jgi:X-X-X-Leu-X-X-Gly heptad repeat protein
MSLLPLTAFAEGSNGTQATSKTETVYVNLDSTGAVEQINVVNAFDISSGETIYDYGNYAEVKNLTDTSKITVDGNRILAVASKDTFYYQGRLEQTDLPWDISIRYFLGGSELTADEIAGKSGEFELRIDIKAGSERYKTFFEQYMMQISLTLNKDLFTNIQSDDGTINIVGSTASVSYTHAMNTEAEYVLRADVHDFEMGAIQFQAASMGDLGLDLGDEFINDDDEFLDDFGGDFEGEFDELTDATGELSENANKLADGSDTFYSGIHDMDAQANDLSSGVGELYSMSGELSNGAAAFGSGLSDFSDALSSLSVASQQIAQGLETLNQQASAFSLLSLSPGDPGYPVFDLSNPVWTPNATPPTNIPSPGTPEYQMYLIYLMNIADQYITTLDASSDQGAIALATLYVAQKQVIGQLTTAIDDLNTAYTQFNAKLQSGSDIPALISGYSKIQDGMVGLNAALGRLNSSVSKTLVPGVEGMISSYKKLNDGTGKLAEAISELNEKAADIPDEFQNKIDEVGEEIKEEIKDKIDEKVKEIFPSEPEKLSFVSEDAATDSVLFIMQTGKITAPLAVADTTPSTSEPETFWDKLLNLFGLWQPE